MHPSTTPSGAHRIFKPSCIQFKTSKHSQSQSKAFQQTNLNTTRRQLRISRPQSDIRGSAESLKWQLRISGPSNTALVRVASLKARSHHVRGYIRMRGKPVLLTSYGGANPDPNISRHRPGQSIVALFPASKRGQRSNESNNLNPHIPLALFFFLLQTQNEATTAEQLKMPKAQVIAIRSWGRHYDL
jgi:hypothetical protein